MPENPCPPNQELDPDDPALDPASSDAERDQIKDGTTQHAKPARLEDEGQSGG